MRRLGSLLATVVLAAALTGGSAAADYEWSANDPVFNIRGTVFRLTASVQADASDVTAMTFNVTLPADAAGVTTVAYPQGAPRSVTVIVSYTGAPSADSYTVSATAVVAGPPGAAVRLVLTGPSVTAASWEGSTNTVIAASFSAAK